MTENNMLSFMNQPYFFFLDYINSGNDENKLTLKSVRKSVLSNSVENGKETS